MFSSDGASRRALRSVGKVAATTNNVIHIDRSATSPRMMDEVIAHELTHVAHPSAAPRFFDDIDDSPEERQAEAVARVMARSPLAPSSSTVAPPATVGGAGPRARIQRRSAGPEGASGGSESTISASAMAASITHEFNNILTTTINYAKMGLRHKDDATREKAFNRILSAGQRAARITTGMLGYARSTGVRKEEIDLSQIVSDVLILCEKDLQMNRVKLQTDILGHPVCQVNISHLQQVLLNLIVNARQAMDGGGMLFVTVRTSEDGLMGELEVRDTGAGIPSEELPKIFKPFFTTKEADTNGQGGTGLGLAFCREVIESHKGKMRVASTVGKGTAFTLMLPVAAAAASRKSA